MIPADRPEPPRGLRRISGPKQFFALIAAPGCLLGPAQLFRRSRAAALHRTLASRCWPGRPRWQWGLLLTAALVRWYLVGFWREFDRCVTGIDRRAQYTGKTRWQRVRSLFHLGLYLGVRPMDYYRLRLYRFERSRWLGFVFTQEQQTWHAVHSHPGGAAGVGLLRDKRGFEVRARERGLRTVRTLASFRAGDAPGLDGLPPRRPIFLKPNSANAMRGCMTLERCDGGEDRLRGRSLERERFEVSGREAVEEKLAEAFGREDYLVQEVLRNSREFSRFCGTEELVTVRVITLRIGGRIEPLSAALEVPRDSELYTLGAIGADGRARLHPLQPPQEPVPEFCAGAGGVPHWQELLDLSCRAHGLLPDVGAIAWDLTVTEEGATLLEGNSGWALMAPQRMLDVPLLETPAAEAWAGARRRRLRRGRPGPGGVPGAAGGGAGDG